MLVRCPSCASDISGDGSGHLPPWCPKCGADLADAATNEESGADGPKCYECGARAELKCVQCDDVFCNRHGGYRWRWVRKPLRGYTWIKASVALTVLILIATSIAGCYFAMTVMRF
jgi:hypothetical protein